MNMIGKKSGEDWSQAPEGATHIKYYDDGVIFWYKFYNGIKWYWSEFDSHWDVTESSDTNYSFISKQEDLGMTEIKQVSKIEDLEVGMWLMGKNYKWLVFSKDSTYLTIISPEGCPVASIWPEEFPDEPFEKAFKGWSYTYNGEYTPIVKEVPTPTQIKIKELEESAASIVKQIEELKELSK